MPDLDSLFEEASVVGGDDSIDWLVIDHDFRRIDIPATKQLLGVTSDEKVNLMRFRCPKVCSEVDISEFDFRINYMNAGQEGDVFLVADKEVVGDEITFSWLVDRHACMYAGNVSFIVCAKLFNEEGEIVKEYNTAVHQLPVVEGLETMEDLRPDYNANTDAIEQFLRNAQGFYILADDVTDLKQRTDGLELESNRKVDGGYVENGYLYLTSNGEIVVGPLGPFSSSGSGGGGGGGDTNKAIFNVANSTGWLSKTIANGGTCPISITWSSIEDELSTGEGTMRITVNNVIKAVLSIPQGEVTVDLSKYCSSGANTCAVKVSDIYGNARTITFSVMLTPLSISSSFDSSTPYTSDIVVPFTPVGNVTKTVHFILDGTEIGSTHTSVTGRQLSYTISAQEHGAHSLRIYFDAEINGEEVRSNELFYEFISISSDDMSVIISSSFTLTETTQYSSLSIPFRVYDPSSDTAEVALYINDALVSSQTVDRTEQSYTFRANTAGKTKVSIVSGSSTKELEFTVQETEIDVRAETEDLVLYLNAEGRSNNEDTKNVWAYQGISAEFNNFTWRLDGWQTDEDGVNVLRVVDDARVVIPYKIFEKDFKANGKTIEIEFATRDVSDYSATILSCFDDTLGLRITPQNMTFRGAQSQINTIYKENEHIRLSIVVEKQTENRLILVYINGIMSGAVQYASGERFSQLSPMGITIGSNDCGIDLYNIRVYDNSLNRMQVLDNWIADTQIGEVMLDRYSRNKVYNDSGEITISNLSSNLPYMIVEVSELPQYKGDKKTCKGSYTDPANPTRSFTFDGCQINVQGTSSAIYYRKNYDLQFKDGFMMSGGNVPNYSLKNGSIPFNRFVLKADVASSESANNTVLASFYTDTCPYKTPAMRENPKIRYGIEGVPIVLFWYNPDDQTTTFMGKYNFNLPKRAPEPYGYSGNTESWEWERNNSANVKFQDNDFTSQSWDELKQESYPTWYDDFEARFPSDEWRDYGKLNEFIGWVKSTWREGATNETLPSPVIFRLNSKTTVNDYSSDTSFTAVDEVVNGQNTGYTIFTFTKDTPAYRLTKFRAELDDYAELQSALYYYLYTDLFLMIDSRAKNMFVGFDGDPIS